MKRIMKTLTLVCSIMGLGTALKAEPAATPAPVVLAPAIAADAQPTGSGPKIQFATPVYDFGKTKSGEPVKYSFVFTNTGGQTLEVTHVQPTCGCTTAGDWTHKVEPGQTGTIPIQYNGSGFGQVTKFITVTSNGTNQPSVSLQLKGTVWKPIDVNPQFAMLNIPPDSGSPASTVVRIVNNMEEPITLSAPESNNKSFTAEIKTTQPGKEFELTVKSVPPLTVGNIQGQISVKTSSSNMAVINVPAFANVQPAITVMPAQITLPAPPLPNNLTPAVTIQNNGTNVLTLSEPAVNAKDVDIQIKEMQPGKTFSAMLTFPEGFEIPQGQPVELTIKSSNPRFPMIKVPIVQMQRVAAPVAPLKPAPTAALNPPPASRPTSQ